MRRKRIELRKRSRSDLIDFGFILDRDTAEKVPEFLPIFFNLIERLLLFKKGLEFDALDQGCWN